MVNISAYGKSVEEEGGGRLSAELWHTIIFETKLPEIANRDDLKRYGGLLKDGFVQSLDKITNQLKKYGAEFLPHDVDFNEKVGSLKLSPLRTSYNSNIIDVTVTVNPCLQGSPSSKITSTPLYDSKLSRISLKDFFETSKELSNSVCDVIGQEYYEIIKNIFIREKEINLPDYSQLNKFNLYAYVVGSGDQSFHDLVAHRTEDELLGKIITTSPILKTALDAFSSVRLQSKQRKYHWFSQEQKNKKALFGYLSGVPDGQPEANFIGIIPGSTPHVFTKELIQNVIRVL